MADILKKENIIEMPDNSDMIAEAMKEVIYTSNPGQICSRQYQSLVSHVEAHQRKV
jgi:hypothetical protein